MQIVIDIPEEDYNLIKGFTGGLTISLYKAVQKGTPLPEHHGRIIDESKITSVYYHEENYSGNTVRNYHTVIDGTDAPTIIEGSESE